MLILVFFSSTCFEYSIICVYMFVHFRVCDKLLVYVINQSSNLDDFLAALTIIVNVLIAY